jgi:hypothetical protein
MVNNPTSLLEKVRLIRSFLPSASHTQRDTLYLLLQHTTTLFAYWQLSARKNAMVTQHFGMDWRNLAPMLRLYDVTDLSFDGSQTHSVRQLAIGERSTCYIHDLQPCRSYIADVGILNQHRMFIPLLRSNRVDMPTSDHGSVSESSFLAEHAEQPFTLMLPYEYDLFSTYTLYIKRLTPADSDKGGEER